MHVARAVLVEPGFFSAFANFDICGDRVTFSPLNSKCPAARSARYSGRMIRRDRNGAEWSGVIVVTSKQLFQNFTISFDLICLVFAPVLSVVVVGLFAFCAANATAKTLNNLRRSGALPLRFLLPGILLQTIQVPNTINSACKPS